MGAAIGLQYLTTFSASLCPRQDTAIRYTDVIVTALDIPAILKRGRHVAKVWRRV